MQELSAREIVLRRLAANGLGRPFAGPLECAASLAGIQSQFPQWAEVSLLNRCPAGLTLADLAGFYQGYGLINLWGQRHTLHLYVKEDWEAVSALYEPGVSAGNYAHKRFPADFALLMERLAAESALSPLPRARVLELVEEQMQGRHAGEEWFAYMLIMLACLRGVFCGLPEKPGIKRFIGRSQVLPAPWQPKPEQAALALESIVRRYFSYYGPASLADFSHWAGLPQKAAKACLERLQGELEVFTHAGREYFSLGRAPEEGESLEEQVLLLGKFDPLFVSYRHKDWIIPEKLQKRVWRNAGWVEAMVIEGGRAAGTWRHALKGRKMSLEVSQFAKIKAASRKKIKAGAEKLAAFWEKELDSVSFS